MPIKLGPRSVLECKTPYQYIYLLELASFLFKTLLVQTTQVKNFRKVNTTFVLFSVSFLSNCVQDCMHWANVCNCTAKSLHSECYIKSLILFKHTSMLCWFWCRVYITYFFVFSIKEHEITKNKRKKLYKNVIAKLSGNKVVLLRKNVPVRWPSCVHYFQRVQKLE